MDAFVETIRSVRIENVSEKDFKNKVSFLKNSTIAFFCSSPVPSNFDPTIEKPPS